MNKINYLLLFLFALAVMACSSEKNTFTNRLFHNTTAKYNAYYYADEKIRELETGIANNHREDFSQVLPVFYTIDSAFIETNEELLEEVRSFASKAVDWHRISKWVGPSYFLIGMADYYEANFDDASNTFKYLNVNGKKKDIRHRSLIQLMRLFTDLDNFDDATYVIDFLSKESGISSENKFLLYKTLAYYYHKRGELNGKIGALDKSLSHTKDKKEKSRINFILGQLYQKEGIDALAYDYYNKALRGNPPYERSFFAQLYAQQVAELNKTKDIEKVRSYFDGLYKDSKNKDLKDVILFEKAKFELKQDEIEAAEQLLIRAAKEESQNPIQKGYIYEKLAMINFDKKNDFRAAKFYLDSALVSFRPTDPLFQDITDRKEILDNYVFHYDIVTKNDSLLLLTELSIEAQTLIAENFIKQEEERLLSEAAAKDNKKPSGIFDNLLAFGGRGGSGESFYFDNSLAVQQGSIDFNRNWGNRPLQDNWRRTSQNFQTSSTRTNTNLPAATETDSTSMEENSILSQIPTAEELLSKIPSNPDQIKEMKLELERSYFELGKILFFDLKNPPISIDNLESLITKYPNTIKKPEAYYILYLANKETGGNTDIFAQRLNREFPDSPFTMSVNNPDQASGNVAFLESSRNYKKAYELYYNGQYAEAKSMIRSTLEAHPLTANTDRLLLLDIMVTGKTEDISRFQERLENYIQTTEDAGLVEMARKMLGAFKVDEEQTKSEISEDTEDEVQEESVTIEGEDEEMKSETESPYKNNPNQTHIFVIVLGADKSSESKNLLANLEGFHNENFKGSRLRTGNMNLSRENTIFIVSPFISAQKGIEYREIFKENFKNESLTDEDKANCFLISIENFQELNKRKNLDEYRDFYTKTYY
ncbi:gliding motility protein [Aquiflexum sp. TKW24L]|uniref:type IX secretion system periplasmic lipoprotein PorW/SprE n=1 Tax=Aquiflexum sp. TKW24L TaxID=2942212 RepID=UPI0020C05B48|nr:gliding motility protein [Aquiflexum sp. TKW24L]MCL6258488.1 gliding motility protein [Aquiflexum sp. TKW24L]